MSGIQLTKNDLEARLKEILTRAKSSQSMSRVYPLYQQLQTERFMTENASEGTAWPNLKSEYAKYKEKHYAGYPGAGKKMLIATGTLAGAVIGPGAPFEGTDKHQAIFNEGSMQISVSLSGNNATGKPFIYPSFVAERRPFMEFSENSMEKLKQALSQYLIGSSISQPAKAA